MFQGLLLIKKEEKPVFNWVTQVIIFDNSNYYDDDGDNDNNLEHNTTTYYVCNKTMITYGKKQ